MSGVISYEKQLDANLAWALEEGSLHFEENSAVHRTMRRIAKRLTELDIPYAVVGGMAMFAYGYRRFTDDLDILVTRQSMDKIVEKLEGLGYVQPAGTSTKLRDAESGVRIEFLITGQYPGDGKPKDVAFPDPLSVSIEVDGIRYLGIAALVELKLSSGMTGGIHRQKDIVDVIELIKALTLPRDLVDQLKPSVRDKYIELWTALQNAPPES